MIIADFQTVAQVAAGRGLNTLLEGFALAGLSWAALRCFGARSSMTRFAVWFSTLLVIAGLPLLSRTTSPLLPSGSRIPELTLSGNWAAGLFAAWAVITSVLLVRLGLSLRHVIELRQNCRQIEAGSHPALMETAQEFANARSRRIQLLVSDDVRIPTALGFFRPAVVLPAWTLRDLSPDELNVMLLHELAHLRRWDDWTNLAQKFVKALFFFHPAVWWIDSRLALEREIACDDMVLERTANARTYAASLVSIAEKVVAEQMRMGRALALAQSALGRVREVSQRVAQILDTKRTRTGRGWRPALAIIGTLAVITVGAMPYAPELISFQKKTQPVFSAASAGAASLPTKATPIVFKQPVSWAGEGTRPYVSPGRLTSLRASARRSTIRKSRRVPDPMVIPAKAILHQSNHSPKVLMAKASGRSLLTARLLVWHSSRFDESESSSVMWTLTVWRASTADGEQQTLQETIVMNSL
jgi:beta-lactamase regulating signal transducer with metallopeptidase domain